MTGETGRRSDEATLPPLSPADGGEAEAAPTRFRGEGVSPTPSFRTPRGSGPSWAIGVVALASALATHYYAVFSVAGFGLGLARSGNLTAISSAIRRRLWWIAALGAAILLTGLAWLLAAPGLRTSLSVAYPRLVDPGRLLQAIVESIGAPLAGPLAPQPWALTAALLVGAVVAASWPGLAGRQTGMPPHPNPHPNPLHRARGRGGLASPRLPVSPSSPPPVSPSPRLPVLQSVALWGFLVASLAVPLLLLVGRSFAPRFVAIGVPFFAVLVGLAARRLGGVPLALAGAAYGASALIGLFPIYDGYVRSDYGEAMAYLRAEARPDDAIVLNGPWQDLLYQRYGWGLPPRFIIASSVPLDPDEAVGWLTRLAAAHPRLWVVDAATDAADPQGVVAGWLDAHAYARPVVAYRKALLRPYLTENAATRPLEGRAAAASGLDVQLDTVEVDRWVLHPGEEARLRISGELAPFDPFRAAAPIERRLSAVLAGPDGSSVWHWDGPLVPAGNRLTYRAALVIPEYAAPGGYEIRAAIYEPARDAEGRRVIVRISEAMPIGALEVQPRPF